MATKNSLKRKRGKKGALGSKADRRFLSFNFSKKCNIQGESFDNWQEEGILDDFLTRITQLSALTVPQAIAQKHVTIYTKVTFPPKSGFTSPKHIHKDISWATFHIKPKSKEVIAGYLEQDIFFIVFLDKNHLFWKCELKNT
jgi:hypothetical protein